MVALSDNLRKLSPKERARHIDKALRIVWESLESHLELAYGDAEGVEKEELESEREHHKRSVHDYAKLMELISTLY